MLSWAVPHRHPPVTSQGVPHRLPQTQAAAAQGRHQVSGTRAGQLAGHHLARRRRRRVAPAPGGGRPTPPTRTPACCCAGRYSQRRRRAASRTGSRWALVRVPALAGRLGASGCQCWTMRQRQLAAVALAATRHTRTPSPWRRPINACPPGRVRAPAAEAPEVQGGPGPGRQLRRGRQRGGGAARCVRPLSVRAGPVTGTASMLVPGAWRWGPARLLAPRGALPAAPAPARGCLRRLRPLCAEQPLQASAAAHPGRAHRQPPLPESWAWWRRAARHARVAAGVCNLAARDAAPGLGTLCPLTSRRMTPPPPLSSCPPSLLPQRTWTRRWPSAAQWWCTRARG
jgi:hypothetical protein